MHCFPVSTCIRPSLNFDIITLSTYYLLLEYSQLYKSFLLLVRLFVYGVIKMFAALIANCCPFDGSVLIQIPAIYHNLVLNNTNFYPVQCDGRSRLYSTFFSSSTEYNANKLFLYLYSVFEVAI